jgi:small subunit ribosomal protein S15e
MDVFHCRARRRFQRGLKRKPMILIKKLRKAKKETLPNEKPAVVKTHLRDMIVVPEMIGSVIGIYNGKTFNQVEIKVNLFIKLSFIIFTNLLISLKWLVTT